MNAPDDAPETADTDVDEAEVVALMHRYFAPGESVGDDELRDCLQQFVRGTIVEFNPDDVDITVIVEWVPNDADDPIRDAYSVHPTNEFDGDSTLTWSYLGSAD